MALTEDPNDPRLGHGADRAARGQNEAYLVLSAEELAKGFIRPVRRSYLHVGVRGHEDGLVPPGCGTRTHMGLTLCETYARQPTFYGATFCCGCNMHRPVAEFIWDEDGAVVGS